MNTPVLFLLGALALALLGAMIVWIASRPRKQRFGHSIHTFNQDLRALAPPRPRAARPAPGPRPRRPNHPDQLSQPRSGKR